MTVIQFREHLLKERLKGKRPEVVLVSESDYKELVEDLPGKNDPLESLTLYGAKVTTPAQVLLLTDPSLHN